MQSWIFSIITLIQSSVSRDPSEIILICWFAAQETFPIIIHVFFIVLPDEAIIITIRISVWQEN